MDKIEIPHSVRDGLILIGQNVQLSAEGFKLIAEGVFQNALNIEWAESNITTAVQALQRENSLKALDGEALVNYFGNLATFTSLCSRQSLNEETVRDYVTNCGWSSAFVDSYVKRYTRTVSRIRSYLASIGNRGAKLVDVNWQLDLQHKNGQLGVTNSVLYLVEFQLEKDGRLEVLHFSATKPELEDLVCMLRDASHCIRRVAS